MTRIHLSATIALMIAAAAAAQTVGRNPAVSDSVWASGIPVIEINTQDCAEIDSRETYVNMASFVLTDLADPANDVIKNGGRDQIRGRGNTTWHYPKKPYRVRFREPTGLFGRTPQRVWVLLAEFLDPTFLMNAAAFELGRRVFDLPFVNSYRHVHLYLNDEYQGLYVLTEQVQVNAGRVDINQRDGWLVEIDTYYDEEPKFTTPAYNLPVMIKSPEFSGNANMTDPAYEFVRNDIFELTDSMASRGFPENGYGDLIDINAIVDYMLLNEIVLNYELGHPKSVFAYKDAGGKIALGPPWDFDCAYAYADSGHVYFTRHNGFIGKHPFLGRFFQDPVFFMKFFERWNEKSAEIAAMTSFIDSLGGAVSAAAREDFKIWGNIPGGSHAAQVSEMADWWLRRWEWLNNALNTPRGVPAGTILDSLEFKYPDMPPREIAFIAYGDISDVAASLEDGNESAFDIVGGVRLEPAENGGIFAYVGVKPKRGLWVSTYTDAVILTGTSQGIPFQQGVFVNFTVLKTDPAIPQDVTAIYGQTLAEVGLPDYDDWRWIDDSNPVGNAGLQTHRAEFAPEDTVNYNPIAEYYWVTVNVLKAVPEVTLPAIAPFTYDPALTLSQISLESGAGDGVFEWTDGGAVPVFHNSGYGVIFTPNDTGNYLVRTDTIALPVLKADPYHTVPPPMPAVRGEPLANLPLPEQWAWMDETMSVGGIGRQTHLAMFTPLDTANYNILTDIEITVSVFRRYSDRYGVRFEPPVATRNVGIRVVLPEEQSVRKVVIYDNMGNTVFETAANAGTRRGTDSGNVIWDLTNGAGRFVAAGTYLVVAVTEDRSGRRYRYSARLYVNRRWF